ncbi:CPBP family intramembrane metalloprotease [Pedobacter changchengzhani]|uniref:CPBP family intramembrane metalloprotease n=1 Tax=Pedobacter changchengzhani TaxID=2529274 RepID=A0A4R5MMR5_9SPHI|nr:CPBP family intramembrane metalloprotease [Pedobacter changchengzhani]
MENLIAGTIVAGFIEELYFRGLLFGLLNKGLLKL